jgi:hypothetical protein
MVGGPAMVAGGIAARASALVLAPASNTASLTATAVPGAPAGLTATAAAVPGAPAGLTASAGNARVSLSWAAPASDGGSPVVSYKVYIATTPGAQESTAIATKGTGGIVTGLVNGTTYYFTVTAIDAAGNESPPSTGVSAEPTAPTRGEAASLTSPTSRKQLIAFLAAAAAVVAAGALTLVARSRRRSSDLARSAPGRAPSGQQIATSSDVRAVPDIVRPDVVNVCDTGQPTHTIRLEPNPGVATTTIEERRP